MCPCVATGGKKSLHVPDSDPSILPPLILAIVADDSYIVHLFMINMVNPKAMSMLTLECYFASSSLQRLVILRTYDDGGRHPYLIFT